MRTLSKKSNPSHDPDTGEGGALESIPPWAVLWGAAIAIGWLATLGIALAGIESRQLDGWMVATSGVLAISSAPFLLHIIITTSRQQAERYRGISSPWRATMPNTAATKNTQTVRAD